ncbi:selectin platelet-like isoform 2 [Scophthalmus maximus]|uniref:E-selectin n=2 Tax=Scophthalmus maximus TaxID=52904 RepID=A0A2U9C336_SCOMX|nr:selectin platelet-like isoform 2 [Scophthalmus maximus]
MNWTQARQHCKTNYTDMVVIQSQEENDYLVSLLPNRKGSPYYWIGITRNHKNETWTWLGNNSTWIGNESWAENEPNNNHSTEFCVEIYVKTGNNRGRWNDEKCSNKKYPVCYKAQCNAASCGRGTCRETIQNITCHCQPGFKGDRCQTAVKCPHLPLTDNGDFSCSRGNQTFNSTCQLKCHLGFLLTGLPAITCRANGVWSGPRPTCTSYKHALLAVAGCGALSALCCICFCWMKRRKRECFSICTMSQESVDTQQSLHHRVLIVALIVFTQDLSSSGGAQAWTYNYSITPNRRWPQARQWCQQHFTDMVAVQNQEETDFINNLLPFNPKYYWIGVRKVDGVWTREGNSKVVPEDARNWAPEEPDDIAGQDCVEIYIKRERDTAMWNNEKCHAKKGTVCYTASCTQDSCSAHADCVETVGNYTCRCHPGFHGPRCEEAIACKPLSDPEQGSHYCFHPYGFSRFNSSCRFHCELGFRLVGMPQLLCQTGGRWNHHVPLCQVEQCPVLNHTNSSGGRMNCSHPIAPDSYNSTCEFRCEEGYELRGEGQTRCDHTGQWTASVPACTIKKCGPIFFPVAGNVTCVDTVEPFSFGSQCNYACQEGYDLSGDDTLVCLASGQWSKPTPTCAVVQCNSLEAPPHASMQCQEPFGVFSYGSICTVQCEEGFDLTGTNMTTCSSQGNWSHTLPVCLAKKCPSLDPPSHGSLSCSDPHGEFSFGSRCTSTCQEGFVLNGTTDTECTSVGAWSSETEDCRARPCPLLAKAPQHGGMNCSHPFSPFSFDSHCDFECDEGFWLRGTPTMACNHSGLWSQDLPTCELVQCEAIRVSSSPLSKNCSHPLGNFSFGSQCLFACEDGFSLNGTEVLGCLPTGVWSDSLPNCTEDMPVGAPMLMYSGAGAASVVVPLVLIGLALLILTRSKRRGIAIISDMPSWEERENPAFEF